MAKPKWLDKGFSHIWLPYTQMQQVDLPHPVVKTEGVRLYLEDGSSLIDGISSWWSACHGYNHPHILSSMQEQLNQMPHVMFAGLANEPAYRLAERLAAITPEGLDRVFFSDSGSTAVETAMKMAVQYWHNKGERNRTKFITFHNGYHGDTMGCMSLSDPEGMHSSLKHYIPMQYAVDIPAGEYDFAEFDHLLDDIHKNVAGVIIEPLVQGAGGFKFFSPDTLAEIYRICKKHDVLFIADEIMTGFGRTGSLFACNEAAITPDIMCLGKGLTGGVMTLAAVMATEAVYEAFLSDHLSHALMSGPTFMGNALACSAANASLDLFDAQHPHYYDPLAKIATIESLLLEGLESCRSIPAVVDVRVKGAIGVVQLDATQDDMWELRKALAKQGVWLRPFSNVLYIMPPFIIEPEDLQVVMDATRSVISKM